MMEIDNRVEVEISLGDDEWYQLMRMAHEKDITLNQLVQEVLAAEIDRIEKEQS